MSGNYSIEQVIKPVVDAGELAGAAALIWRDGKVVQSAAVGWRDIEAGLPIERDTLFRIASSEAANSAQAVNRRFTNIWRKSGTTWQMIALHANVVP